MTLQRTSVLIAPVVILLLFASTLVGIDRLAFRDVSHFYLPLYDYVAERTSQQWLPLWNPLDHTGMPLIGETTTAVLYPIRYLVFGLPLPTEVALSWYIVLHLVLASLSSRWAALRSGVSPFAATLAGIIYPLSGGVFFLYTNPPYLVGAAWLPLVLGALVTSARMTAPTRSLIAGPAMAMMILGGDPQTALHAMLVAVAVYIVRLLRSDPAGLRAAAISLIAVPSIAACLTAPQLAASLSWSGQSDRVHQAVEAQAWYEPPQRGSHRSNAYQFSLPPWHIASMLTPNAWGRLFPVYQRISAVIRGDGRMWTPSIYLGLLAALAITSQLLRRKFDLWMAICIGAFLLCLGHFGFVWLVQQIPGLLPNVDSAIGGPYWILYQCLPGYDSFRYPVKWLPVFSLAVAITTSRWVDSTTWSEARQAIAVLASLLIIVIAAVAILSGRADNANPYLDPFWGPLDIAGARTQLQWSILHSLLALTAVVVVLRIVCRRKNSAMLVLLTLIVAIDLGYSNCQWVAKVSRSEERSLRANYRQNPIPTASLWIRARAGRGWPVNWRRESDRNRVFEVAASERVAWFGRWHLADRQAVVNSMTSIRSHQMALFWKACAELKRGKNASQTARCWQSIHRWLGIDGVLTSGEESAEMLAADLVDVTHATETSDRFRFHVDWSLQERQDIASFATFIAKVDRADGNASPLIHSSDKGLLPRARWQDVEYQVTPVDDDKLQLETNAFGVLTRPVIQDGHWTAEIRSLESQQWQSAPVYKVSFLKQGMLVSPGQWQIRFRYRPDWLSWSLAIALGSWVVLVYCVLRRCFVATS